MSARAWITRTSTGVQAALLGAEHVQRADDLLAQAQRERVHRPEPGGQGAGGELRPAVRRGGEVGVHDGRPLAIAVLAGALSRLYLEQLEQVGALVGGGHELEVTLFVGEEEPSRSGAEELRRPGGDHLQELHDVELLDEGVGELDEDLRDPVRGQRAHRASPSFSCVVAIMVGHARARASPRGRRVPPRPGYDRGRRRGHEGGPGLRPDPPRAGP